ncbi:FAD binding domain-containing protein [Alkalicoccobacillus porphyridii]|uniref:FAD-binding PCMH-type domain-containing protein n=1 Tax=Alkalicoccobacillus porphyridii TaxID=2597270 RepID=A0A554A3P7_9BACI|nr:FAD binding domain-containing protein [Alkalicoccobacillus porphyridii]TSB48312.1 hypothetical protein FN960_01805 [Alkalicoccobacillus porphyridii]
MQQLFTNQIKVWTPQSVEEAWSLKQTYGEDAEYVSGGTLIQLRREQTGFMAKHLISLDFITGFQEVAHEKKSSQLTIGAGVRLRAGSLNPDIQSMFPILHQALRTVGARAIQNQASVGGNIAYRKGDIIPALLALDAQLTLYHETGYQLVPISEYMSTPLNSPVLITAIHLPVPNKTAGEMYFFEKLGRREAFVPSTLTVSIYIKWNELGEIVYARLAVGGGDHSPQRLTNCESLLMQQAVKSIVVKQIHRLIKNELVIEGNDFTSGDYQSMVAANLISASLSDAAQSIG